MLEPLTTVAPAVAFEVVDEGRVRFDHTTRQQVIHHAGDAPFVPALEEQESEIAAAVAQQQQRHIEQRQVFATAKQRYEALLGKLNAREAAAATAAAPAAWQRWNQRRGSGERPAGVVPYAVDFVQNRSILELPQFNLLSSGEAGQITIDDIKRRLFGARAAAAPGRNDTSQQKQDQQQQQQQQQSDEHRIDSWADMQAGPAKVAADTLRKIEEMKANYARKAAALAAPRSFDAVTASETHEQLSLHAKAVREQQLRRSRTAALPVVASQSQATAPVLVGGSSPARKSRSNRAVIDSLLPTDDYRSLLGVVPAAAAGSEALHDDEEDEHEQMLHNTAERLRGSVARQRPRAAELVHEYVEKRQLQQQQQHLDESVTVENTASAASPLNDAVAVASDEVEVNLAGESASAQATENPLHSLLQRVAQDGGELDDFEAETLAEFATLALHDDGDGGGDDDQKEAIEDALDSPAPATTSVAEKGEATASIVPLAAVVAQASTVEESEAAATTANAVEVTAPVAPAEDPVELERQRLEQLVDDFIAEEEREAMAESSGKPRHHHHEQQQFDPSPFVSARLERLLASLDKESAAEARRREMHRATLAAIQRHDAAVAETAAAEDADAEDEKRFVNELQQQQERQQLAQLPSKQDTDGQPSPLRWPTHAAAGAPILASKLQRSSRRIGGDAANDLHDGDDAASSSANISQLSRGRFRFWLACQQRKKEEEQAQQQAEAAASKEAERRRLLNDAPRQEMRRSLPPAVTQFRFNQSRPPSAPAVFGFASFGRSGGSSASTKKGGDHVNDDDDDATPYGANSLARSRNFKDMQMLLNQQQRNRGRASSVCELDRREDADDDDGGECSLRNTRGTQREQLRAKLLEQAVQRIQADMRTKKQNFTRFS